MARKELGRGDSAPSLLALIALAAVYFLAAKLGLRLAFQHSSATAVWPPTGVALAALVLRGYRLWPGVFVGAFLANVTTAGSVATSLGIATGNTLEGLLGAHLANRYAQGRDAFDRPRDVFRWAVLAGLASTALSATFGVTNLALGGYLEWADVGAIWLTWWLGDAGGALVVAPLLILWGRDLRPRWSRRQVAEVFLIVLALLIPSEVVFGVPFELGARTYPFLFSFFPLLAWAALRVDPRATATAMLAIWPLSLWGTLQGHGPLAAAAVSRNEALVFLQVFLCVLTMTGLALAAAVEQRKSAQRELAVAAERLRFLADSSRLLASSLDYETTLANFAALAVPRVADCCAVHVLDEGRVRQVALVHTDPAKAREVQEWLDGHSTEDPGRARGYARVLRTGEPELSSENSDPLPASAVGTAEEPALHRTLGPTSSLCVPLLAGGRTLGAITLALVEPKRRYQEADLVFAEELAGRAAMALENARLYTQAQQAVRVREEFLSIASHELRTPLTSLRLQVQIAERALAEQLARAEEATRSLGEVMKTVTVLGADSQRMVRLVNGLFDVTRIAAGKLELQPEDLDFRDVVGAAIDQLRSELAQRRVELVFHAPVALPGHWDRLRLEQVATNLLSNAIKYGDGKPIRVEAEPVGEQVLFTVRDEGGGIEPRFLARIFDRFERGGAYGQPAGLGLGLYITRQIVEAHGGTIEVESEPGRGTTFSVRLPRAAASDPANSQPGIRA